MIRSNVDHDDELTQPIDAPMSLELAEELRQWQELGQDAWALFPHNEKIEDVLPETRIGDL